MLKRLVFLFFIAFNTSVLAQSAEVCLLSDHLNELFYAAKKHHGDQRFLLRKAIPPQEGNCLHENAPVNTAYLQYLLTHFAPYEDEDQLLSMDDSTAIQAAFIASLEADSVFMELMADLDARRYDSNATRDTLSLNEILDYAVKYFSIIGLTPEGHYRGKVCAGINGITETEAERNPHIEAFCFSSILENMGNETHSMYPVFVNGIRRLYTLNLGLDEEERLLRAQGAMYMFMREQPELTALLKMEYGEKRHFLPFVLLQQD